MQVDCAAATDKASVLHALALGLRLPEHFGHNLDALYDCLVDLRPAPGATPGILIVLRDLPAQPTFDPAQRDALLSVFIDAADAHRARGRPFRVLYSVRGSATRAMPG